MKDRRKFMKDGLAAAAAILSGSAVYWASQGDESSNECYPDPPTHSVSISPSKYRLDSCDVDYKLELEDSEQRPVGIPEELYGNSSSINNSE